MWETIGSSAASIGVWTGFVLWILLLMGSCFSILISLPGGWVALGLAVVYDLFFGFSAVGWMWLAVFTGLLVVGEILESILGLVYVAKKGATRYGIIGGFLGGLAGAVLGSGVMPIVGTLVGSIVGAFVGAVGGEYLRDQRLEPSLRIGLHSTVGRLLATTVKFALSLAGSILVIRAGVPA